MMYKDHMEFPNSYRNALSVLKMDFTKQYTLLDCILLHDKKHIKFTIKRSITINNFMSYR